MNTQQDYEDEIVDVIQFSEDPDDFIEITNRDTQEVVRITEKELDPDKLVLQLIRD